MESPSPPSSPSRSPTRISSTLAHFESEISKNSGHASSARNLTSNVSASPVKCPFARRHSLMTGKYIKEEQTKSNDFRANPLISPTKFHRAIGVGSTSRSGIPPPSIFDYNGSNTNSEEGLVDDVDYGYGSSHSSRHSASKGEVDDDDCASFYELDEVDEDSFAEADQEPAPSDEIAAVKITEEDARDHVNIYSKKNQTKKDIEVQKMHASMTDISSYRSPTSKTKNFHGPATIGKIKSPGVFKFEAEVDPVKSSAKIIGKDSGYASSRNLTSSVGADPVKRRFVRRHSSAKNVEHETKANHDFQASSVAASPVRRTFGRRPSLMTAKYIEHVKTANDDLKGGNVAASPVDADSDQGQEDELDYGYGVSTPKTSDSSGKGGRNTKNLNGQDAKSPGVFSFDAEVDPVESSARAPGKTSGHISSRNLTDNVAANPARRPFARRHSLMTAKDIQHEKNANDDLQTSNVAASPVRHTFGRRPSLMTAKYIEHVKTANDDLKGGNVAASPVDADSDQGQEDELDYGYGVSTPKTSDSSGKGGRNTKNLNGQDAKSPGVFNFDTEVDHFESAARAPGKKSGHISSRNLTDNVAANPARRPFARRHSLMRAKDIQHEKNANDDLKTSNVAASPVRRTFGRRPSLMTAKYIEHVKTANDDYQGRNVAASFINANSDQAQEDEVDYGYGVSTPKTADSNEEGHQDDSLHLEDEDDDDMVTEADEEPAPRDKFDAVRDQEENVNLYSQEHQRTKKELERKEKLEVQKMDGSMTDFFSFQSPTKSTKKSYAPSTIGKIDSPGIFNFEVEEDPVEFAKEMLEKKAHMNSLRPGMMRGSSIDVDDDAPEKPQKVKDDEEKNAKVELVELLYQAFKQEKSPLYLKAFCFLRKEYIAALDKLRPRPKPFFVHTNANRNEEANKVNKYGNLKNAWERYEDTAQDKPYPEDFTPDEKAAEERTIGIETAVNRDWQDYAEDVVKGVQDNDGSDDGSDDDSEGVDDDEWDFWILEAKRLKAETERKKVKEERARRRKKKEEQQKRLEAEDDDIVEAVKRLKEEARKKEEEEEKVRVASSKLANKMRPGMTRGTSFDSDGCDDDNDDDDDKEEEIAVVSNPVKNRRPGVRRGRSFFEDGCDDNTDEEATAAAVSRPVNNMRPGVRRGPSFVEDDNDDDNGEEAAAAVSKPVKNRCPGVRRGHSFFEDGCDDNNDEGAAAAAAVAALSKPVNNMRPGMTRGRSFFEDGCDDNKDEEATSAVVSRPVNNMRPGTTRGTSFDIDGCDGDNNDEQAAAVVSKPVNNMRPGMTRGRSSFEDGCDDNSDDRAAAVVSMPVPSMRPGVLRGRSYDDDGPPPGSSAPRRINSLRPGMKRGTSFDNDDVPENPQDVKDAEAEQKAKPSKTKESNIESNDTENVGKAKSRVDEDERKQRKEQRRQKREAAKSKDMSKEIVVGTSDDARRRQAAFSWYSKNSTPNRLEFKQRVAALYSFNTITPDDLTPDDVDLLPWNAAGTLVNIAKMNALTRASLMIPKRQA